MRKIKPKFVYDEDNKKRGVLLTFKDFEILEDELDDYYCYELVKDLEPFDLENTISLEEVRRNILSKMG